MDIRVGTCSWTDKTLIDSKAFYPAEAKSAEDRLRYYAEQFPVVEVDSTYYALPSERNSIAWVERTPEHFTFHIKAFGAFTTHPIEISRLPQEIRHFLKGEKRKRVYQRDLPDQAQEMIRLLFNKSLEPLDRAGKLGMVLFQFPHWFKKNKQNVAYLRELVEQLPYQAAVEFRGGGWMDEGRQESTLSILEEIGATYVCVDEPQGFASSVPPVLASTNKQLAVMRFHGRNADTWEETGITPAERFRYLYSDDELREWIEPARKLAEQSKQVHMLFNNCYADYGVRNAVQMGALLESA